MKIRITYLIFLFTCLAMFAASPIFANEKSKLGKRSLAEVYGNLERPEPDAKRLRMPQIEDYFKDKEEDTKTTNIEIFDTSSALLTSGASIPGISAQEFQELVKRANKGDENAQTEIATRVFFGKYPIGWRHNAKPRQWSILRLAPESDLIAHLILKLGSLAAEKNYIGLFEGLNQRVRENNPIAQTVLGIATLNKQGVNKHPKEAISLFYKASNKNNPRKGNAIAQTLLSHVFLNGHGVNQDIKAGLFWLEKASEKGFGTAQNSLGDIFRQGRWVKRNDESANYWFKQAAMQGNATAQNSYGESFKKGWGVKQDHLEAAKWFRKSAKLGNVPAQINLAHAYMEGKGVKQDYRKAAIWFQKAKQNNPDVQMKENRAN